MNPNFGYQMYQTQRPLTRAQIIADDDCRGRQAAAISRTFRRITRRTRTSSGTAANTVAGLLARSPRFQVGED